MLEILGLIPTQHQQSYNMYKVLKNFKAQIREDAILRVSDNAFIPLDPANTDYQAYLKWLSEGNEPLPPDEPLTNQNQG